MLTIEMATKGRKERTLKLAYVFKHGSNAFPTHIQMRAPSRASLLGTYTSFREASMRRKMKRRMVKPQSDEPP